jgi:hypothetical protein
MQRPEQAIHKAVVSHLNARSEPRVFFFHPANGGKRSIIEAKIFKALGVIAGVPDLIILKAGEVFGLELKATRGALTPSQRLVHAAMTEAGAKTAVAHSLDEALVTLEVWGILKRSVSNRVPSHSKGNAETA